ncbi:hypothetical protein D3C72_1022030 [compost metagenome]
MDNPLLLKFKTASAACFNTSWGKIPGPAPKLCFMYTVIIIYKNGSFIVCYFNNCELLLSNLLFINQNVKKSLN